VRHPVAGDYDITLTDSADDGSNEITTLNIVATGDLAVAAAAGDVALDLSDNVLDTTVNISGAGDIDILVTTAATNGDIVISAASLAGALAINAEDEMVSIAGGLGADSVDVSNLAAGETITLVGGAGNDTIDGGNANLTGATITGFEILSAHTYGLLASQLHNATYVVSDGAVLNINVTSASIDITTINLSGLTFADATDDVTVDLTAIDTSVLTSGLGFTYTGSDAEDIVTGSANADTINGGAGIDTLAGGAGADTINGGAGADTITGGTGADTLTGGAGADNFVFANGDTGLTVATADTITDFTTASDTIELATFATVADVAIADGSAVANLAALVVLADAAFVAGDTIYVAYDALGTGNAYVLEDTDGDAVFDSTDVFVILTGVNLATEIVAADFV
jgi:Ca2+-binding RTX toxin-like protein